MQVKSQWAHRFLYSLFLFSNTDTVAFYTDRFPIEYASALFRQMMPKTELFMIIQLVVTILHI